MLLDEDVTLQTEPEFRHVSVLLHVVLFIEGI